MVHTEDVCKKLSASQRARWDRPGEREKSSSLFKKIWSDPERRKRKSLAMIGNKNAFGSVYSEEIKKKMSARTTAFFSNQEERDKQASRRRGKKASLEARENMSKSAKMAWARRRAVMK